MFNWRRKRDGFEWNAYVQTTRLVRRAKRRDRLAEAKVAALDGAKDAGRIGVAAGVGGLAAAKHGAKAAGRAAHRAAGDGARQLSHNGQHAARIAKLAAARAGHAVALAASSAAGSARTNMPVLLDWLYRTSAWVWGIVQDAFAWAVTCVRPLQDRITPALHQTGDALREPLASAALAAIAVLAAGSAVLRWSSNGWTADVFAAALFAAVSAAVLIAVRVLGRSLQAAANLGAKLGGKSAAKRRPPQPFASRVSALAPLARLAARQPSFSTTTIVRPATTLAIFAGAGVGLWLVVSATAPTVISATTAVFGGSIYKPAATLSGRATAVSGDTLKIGRTTVALSDIEAPLASQRCLKSADSTRTFACGSDARRTLARLVRGRRVTCTPTGGQTARGNATAHCTTSRADDIAAEMVRRGFAFAGSGFFPRHSALQSAAETARRGMWAGIPVRPDAYRDARWRAAEQSAPDGCPIKGRVSRGTKRYVLPWSGTYDTIKIRERRGERWFCSEDDARAAGFKPSA